MLQSYIALGTVALTAVGLYFTIRWGIRKDRREKELAARTALDDKINKAIQPYKDRIVELTGDHEREIAQYQRRITELQESQERVIDNATVYFRDRLTEIERDRDYWRTEARSQPAPPPPVSED